MPVLSPESLIVKDIIDGSDIRVGNKIIGLASNGLHSNGFSLVRKVCFSDGGLSVHSFIEELDSTLGEELLKPTRIYVQSVLNVLKNYQVNGMIHNTGGGFYDNIPRVLPAGCSADIKKTAWNIPPIFTFLAKLGAISEDEMFRTFNMGIGYMAIVKDEDVNDVIRHFEAVGESPYIIGEVVPRVDENPEVTIS